MAAPSKAWVTIADSQVDADSPGDTTLVTGFRDDLVHLREWLGMSYTAAQNHDHDGVNSKLTASAAAGSIGQGQLKTTTGAVSTSDAGHTNLTLPGGEYGFYPNIKMSVTDMQSWSAMIVAKSSTFSGWTSYINNISLATGGSGLIYAQQRYMQASPPYKIGDVNWGHFLFLLRKIAIGEVVASYEAEDPPWAYNGKVWLPKDHTDKISEVPHPFTDYWMKDPAVDGLEIVLVNLNAVDTGKWRADNQKVGKGLIEDLSAVLTGKGKMKAFADYSVPMIARFTDRVKVVEP